MVPRCSNLLLQSAGVGVLAVKGKILTIDLPHELRAILNSLFELLLRLPF